MADITELERRITAALDRIGTGVDALAQKAPEPAGDSPEVVELREALEAEKTANAQLEERVRAVRAKYEERVRDLEDKLKAHKGAVHEAQTKMQSIRSTNQHLRGSLQKLRDAAANGTPEPHLINQAMMSEMEGLRALRDSDRAEMDDILGALEPMLKEGENA